MQVIAYSSSLIPCKNQRELLTSWIVFAVNRYECFMENRNIRRFCGCKPFKKKNNIEPHQNFTGSYKRTWRLSMNSKIHSISENKKANKLWQKLLEQHIVKFINYVYLREKEAYKNKWNVLVQCYTKNRLGLLCKWYFSRHLQIYQVYSLEKNLVHMVIHVRKIFNSNVLFQMPCNCCETTLNTAVIK